MERKKYDRSNERIYKVEHYTQACPRDGCMERITWQRVFEVRSSRSPVPALKKQRFRQCCFCAGKERHESQILARRRPCQIVRRTTKPR